MTSTDTERAIHALLAYGYVYTGAGYTYRNTTWVAVADGLTRSQREADGTWAAVPYTIAPAWAGVAGLLASEHPECFTMVYPYAYVAGIYEAALAGRVPSGV